MKILKRDYPDPISIWSYNHKE